MKSCKSCWFKDSCENYGTDKCSEDCTKFSSMLKILQMSGLPHQKYGMIILEASEADEHAYEELSKYKDNIVSHVKAGDNLFIYSKGTGNGKTSWAIKILQQYLYYKKDKLGYDYPGFFIPTQAFLLDRQNKSIGNEKFVSVRSSNSEEQVHLKNLCNADLIVWDDFALKTITPQDLALLFAILDARTLRNKSNIFTSGLTLDELNELYGAQLLSRVLQNNFVVELTASDYRLKVEA